MPFRRTFRRTFRRAFRRNRATGAKRYTGKRYTGKRYTGRYRKRIRSSLTGVTAHKFVDRNQGIFFYSYTTLGGTGNFWTTTDASFRTISSASGDVQFYQRPNLALHSNLYVGLRPVFTHCRFVKSVTHVRCQFTAAVTSAAGALNNSYMLTCHQYPFENIPMQATSASLNPALVTYNLCLDNPTFKKHQNMKPFTITSGAMTQVAINSQIGITANTPTYKPIKAGKLTIADQNNTFYNGFMLILEAASSPFTAWSMETDYHFIMYNPY